MILTGGKPSQYHLKNFTKAGFTCHFRPIMKKISAISAFILLFVALFTGSRYVVADNTYFAISPGTPFQQNWSNISLLNAADDWSGVPSINGYSDNVTDNAGGDPQLQLIPSTTIDLNPNQNNPSLYSTGGVTEFDRGTVTNFVVALQGSGSADFPNLDIRLNTNGCSSPANTLRMSYNLRDLDGSADNAVQPMALHYRVGNAGNYTNVAAGYVADATTGPSLATLVTPVSVDLPTTLQGQPQAHLRIMTTNAVGNDELVGIDDINITCQPAANLPPVAVDDNQNTTLNVPLVVNGSVLTSNDSDPEMQSLTVTAVGNAVNGTVGLSAGVVTFTPTAGFTGAASFEYTVSDGALTDVGLVNVTVSGPVFNGAVNVGTGESITSLTNAGGLFEQMNSGTVSGDVIVNLTSDLSGETGTHALNQLTETGSGGYTVFVRASGAARSIEGSSALGLIRLNGADRITFSGLALGPYGISVRNTGTGPVFRLENDASGNAIRSCSVEGGNADVNSGVIVIGDGAALGSGNDNNSITDNRVRDRSDAAGVPANLIRVAGLDGLARNTGTTISNNLLFDYTTSAIVTGFAEDTSINGNTIFQASPRVTVSAISLLASSGTNSVELNIIRDHTVTSGFVGINMQDAAGTTTISRNRVFEIEHSGAGGGVLQGIHLVGDNAAATVHASNNMLSIAPASATSAVIFGIQDARLQGSGSFVHNSIHVGGTSSGADSHAFLRGIGSTSSTLLTDNILFNSRTGGNSFAVGDQSSRAGSWSSDSNLFVGTGTTPSNFFDFGGAAVDFAAWKASPPAQDASSIASVANVGPFNVGNIFASASDLHLRTIGNNPAINAAGASGVTVDFDGQTRPFNGAPDIGADEVQTATTAAEALISGRVVTLDGRGIRNVRIVVSGGSLPSPRSLVTNAFGYFSIDGLRAGEVYLVSVSGKRFVFDTPARIVSLGEDAFDIDFVGVPR